MRKWLALATVLLSGITSAQAAVSPCVKDRTLRCLKTNARSLYRNNFTLFFAILQQSREAATKCHGRSTADFLEAIPYLQENTDAAKYYYSNLEKVFAINHTECFLRAYGVLSPPAKKLVLQDLKAPKTVSKAQLHDALLPFAKIPELKPAVIEVLK